MLIREYLNNPMGKGSAIMSLKHIKKDYDARYNEKSNLMRCDIYLINNYYYYHVKVPSSVDTIFYDVVVKFIPTSKSTGRTIFDMNFQIFSNCPSFIFTYAHAYYKKRMLIRELDRKLSREAIKKVADMRNPYKLLAYEYSTYLALNYIVNEAATTLDNATIPSNRKSLNNLLRNVQDWDSLAKKRKLKQTSLRIEAKELEKIKKDKIIRNKPKEDVDNTIEGVRPINKAKNTVKSRKIKRL